MRKEPTPLDRTRTSSNTNKLPKIAPAELAAPKTPVAAAPANNPKANRKDFTIKRGGRYPNIKQVEPGSKG